MIAGTQAPSAPGSVPIAGPQGRPCVVLVHGWCCHAGFWESQVRHLVGRYRVITPDLPGHGGSPVSCEAWNIESFRDALLAVLEQIGADRVTLVGHSLGAAVVLETAARLEERADAVLMVEPFPYDYGHLRPRHVRELMAPFQRDFPGALRKMVFNITAGDTPRRIIENIAGVMAQAPADVGLPAFESLLRWDPEPAFGKIVAPVHCLVGSRYDTRARERYAGSLREWCIEGAGHFPMIEDPGRFNRLLDEVLTVGNGKDSG